MKYIEKHRLESFLKLKGFKPEQIYNESELNKNTCWHKSDNEKITVPGRDIFQSNELPEIICNKDLLNEFRKF